MPDGIARNRPTLARGDGSYPAMPPDKEDLVIRATLVSLAVAAAGLPAASRPPAPHPPGWTIYGDVIVEVVSPKDPASGVPGVR